MPDSRSGALARFLALVRRLFRYIRPYRVWMTGALLLVIGASAALNAVPVVIQRAVDRVLDGGGGAAERFPELIRYGLLVFGLAVFGFLVRYAHGLMTAWVGQRIIRDIRRDVFRRALHLSVPYYDRTPVGRLMTRVTSDVEAVQRFVTEGVVGTIADLFMLLGVTGFMLYVNSYLALWMFLILPFLFALLTVVNLRLFRANRAIRENQSALNAFLQEHIVGMGTLQLFNRESYSRRRFAERNAALLDSHREEVRWFSSYFPLLELTQAGATLIVLGAGAGAVLGGARGVTLGVLVAFLAYVRDFFRPLGDLSHKASSLQEALAAAERLFRLLDETPDITDPAHPIAFPSADGRIEFDRVWFAYDGEHWVLRDVSFVVEPGQNLAIVGATGAGKTSVINLLTRFYDIQQGRILFDGASVRDVRTADLRRRLGLVLQDPALFSASIRDNISLFNPDLPDEAVVNAARYVRADEFIRRLPQGYDTVLEERGGTLSTGQKQLLSLARAIADNPEAMLVLDEATASVDTETEQIIQDALARVLRGRTSIVIAHRLSTIQHADLILVMQNGRIVDRGPHRRLLDTCDYYRRLYDYMTASL
jgi:ATP-binding cassette, subfamily B, multidrug efflux pump